jgi:carbonic anhydrase/acetyltransferase-like protein (isoleucine patch superfamily)
MIIKNRGAVPVIDKSAFVAPNATLVGNVRIGRDSRVMYGATLDSEESRIDVGDRTIICENATLRATAVANMDHPVLLGDHVFISPHATLLGCSIERASYIATGAIILHGATVKEGAVVAVGGIVHAKTVIPSGFIVPPNMIAIGDPVKLYAPNDKELMQAIKTNEFSREAFGVGTGWNNLVEKYIEVTNVRSDEFKSHLDDEIVEGDPKNR